MKHKWNEDKNKCLRCGVEKVHKTERIQNVFGSGIRHYTIYLEKGITLFGKPKCHDPKQLKFEL